MPRHIAGSGVRAGQWVNCGARQNCRLRSSHISEREFYATKAWLKETDNPKNAKDITKEDFDNFKAATVGEEKKWGIKAERLARKDKGYKDKPIQVFEGEANMIQIIPKGAKFVPSDTVFKAPPKTASKPVSTPAPPKRTIDIPGVRDFLLTGNFKSIGEASKQYKISDKNLESMSHLRIQMINADPSNTLVTNKETGKASKLAEIPELRKYVRSGDKESLEQGVEKYHLITSQRQLLEAAREQWVTDEAKKAKAAKKAAKSEKSDGWKPAGTVKSPLRAATDRMVEASSRLTNITDDLSKLTGTESNQAPGEKPGSGLFKKLFGK